MNRVALADKDGNLLNPLPVSAAALPLPAGAATEATLALVKAKTDNLDVLLSTRTKPADQQHVIIDQAKTLKTAAFSLAATGTVVAAVSGKRIKVYAVKLGVDTAITVNFRDGAATALEGAVPLAKNGGFVESVIPPTFLFATTAGNSLDLVISTGSVFGRVSYWDDDAT